MTGWWAAGFARTNMMRDWIVAGAILIHNSTDRMSARVDAAPESLPKPKRWVRFECQPSSDLVASPSAFFSLHVSTGHLTFTL
jgi:hypothetical protein